MVSGLHACYVKMDEAQEAVIQVSQEIKTYMNYRVQSRGKNTKPTPEEQRAYVQIDVLHKRIYDNIETLKKAINTEIVWLVKEGEKQK
jgi:hypothetical protein